MASIDQEIEHQLFMLFRRTFAIHVVTSSGEYELDRSTYGILCLLADEGPQRLGKIASAFSLDPSTITRQVQAVVRLGLAQKAVDPQDRRASIVTLTDEGSSAVERARGHRREMLATILADWTTEDRAEFLRGLTRFNDTISEWIETDTVPVQAPPAGD
ncbi:MarR family winged helix-turn-helix transcriptional regulator [Nocardioides pacificus]